MNQICKLIALSLLISFSLESYAARIDGFQRMGDGDYQFSKFIQSSAGSKFYLSFTTQTPEDAILTLEADGKTTNLANFKLEEGTTYKFPSDDKSITLTEPGTYSFNLMTNNPETSDRLVIVIDQPKRKLSISELENVQSGSKVSADNFAPFNIETDITQHSLFSSKIEPVSAPASTRSVGSKIYKKYSISVPLIENGKSIGSGVFIEPDLILTNKHVVGDELLVRVALKPSGFGNVKNARRYEGTVIKFDEIKDLALVQLNMPVKDIPTVKLAKEKDVEVAMQVHAIGHPRGEYWSYTLGYISQFRPAYSWLEYSADVIQTQTPINPGNSGGPLLNSKGLLVGINSFGSPESPGLNYAVAFTSVKEFLESKKTVVANKKAKAKDKEPKCEKFTFDDGVPAVGCDHDHNGVADRFIIDATQFGGYFEVWFDGNENKIYEWMLRVVPLKGGSGDVWVHHIDKNETGKWTHVGADYDRDWNVDEWL